MAAVLRVLSLVLLASSPLTLGRVTGEVKGIQVFPFHKMLLADPALPDNYNNNLAGQHSHSNNIHANPLILTTTILLIETKQTRTHANLFLLFMASRGSSSTSHNVFTSPFALFQTFAFPLVVVAL